MGIPSDVARGCIVVKLGGGLITRETGVGPRIETGLVAGLARELAALARPLVVIHGTGAYGKPPARRYGYLHGTLGRERREVVAEVSAHLLEFESLLTRHLLDGGLCALRLPVLSMMQGEGSSCRLADPVAPQRLLDLGVTVVVGGGFVPCREGFCVCSSDLVAASLAVALQADCLVFATRARGVYRSFGASERIDDAIWDELDEAALECLPRDGAERDVSGGMPAKVRAGMDAAKAGVPAYIVDGRVPGNLAAAIAGRPISGTRIHA